jgi:Calx-beta domain
MSRRRLLGYVVVLVTLSTFASSIVGATELAAVSGVVRDASGNVLTGVHVSVGGPLGSATDTTDANGEYSLFAPISPSTNLVATVGEFGGLDGRAIFSDPFDLTTDRVIDLTMNDLATLQVTVTDASSNPLDGAEVWFPRPEGQSTFTSIETGVTIADGITGGRGWLRNVLACFTGPAGTCQITAPLGYTTPTQMRVSYSRPGYPSILTDFTPQTFTNPLNQTTATMNTFAVLESTGPAQGHVTLSVDGESLGSAAIEHVQAGSLPDGAVALVGSLSYSVLEVGLGSTTVVTLDLPAGSAPDRVYKKIANSYVDVSAIAQFQGDRIVLSITDGGLGDEDGAANGQIIDPIVPARITPTVSVGNATILENDDLPNAVAPFSVTLSAPSSVAVSVRFTTDHVSTSDGDIVARAGLLTFKPGVTTRYVNVPVRPDRVVETDEFFTVTLSAPSTGVVLGDPLGTGRLIDGESPGSVSMSVGDAAVHEGNSGATRTVKVVVALSAPAVASVTVDAALVTGDAVLGADFQPWRSRQLTFKPGQSKKVITVRITSDLATEAAEYLSVVLSSPVGAVLVRPVGRIVVIDDD